MAPQPQGRFRRFLATRIGWVLLYALATLVVIFSMYLNVLIAIPAVLLFGLAVPIWSGHKRPRYLALGGVIIVVASAPLANALFTQLLQTPVGAAASGSGGVFSNGPPLMQNATVTPYTGTKSTNFTWSVTIFPANHPIGNTTPNELDLYISDCPGATGNNSTYCSPGYTLIVLQNKTLPNTTSPYTVTFHYRIGSNGIWAWQMGIWTENSTTKKPYFQLLIGDPQYNGIEGPVIGGFWVIYGLVLEDAFFEDFLFIAAPYFGLLLVYMLFKARERRRKEAEQRAPGPLPPAGGGGPRQAEAKEAPLPSSSGGPPAATASASSELNCPKCNAVVYAGEQTCWKCGAPLPATTAPAGKTSS